MSAEKSACTLTTLFYSHLVTLSFFQSNLLVGDGVISRKSLEGMLLAFTFTCADRLERVWKCDMWMKTASAAEDYSESSLGTHEKIGLKKTGQCTCSL